MSANYNFEGVPIPMKVTAITTGIVDLTAAMGKAVHRIVRIRVANIDPANAADLNLYLNDGSNTKILTEAIAAKSSLLIDDPIAYTTEGAVNSYPLKVTADASAANRLVATVYAVQAAQDAQK